jgi:DNA-binding PadR family transcriptional regulator
MPVPDLTALQFLILSALLDHDRSGRDLRAVLEEHGVLKSSPAFYQLMARLEDGKLVEGRYEPKVVDGHTVKERFYHITATGLSAWEAARDFYSRVMQGRQRANLVSNA